MTTTGVALYRRVRKDEFPGGPVVDGHAVSGVLYPSFEDTPLPNGRTRLADIRPERDSAGEEFVNPGAGASLFDRKNRTRFPRNYWWFFTLPEGTIIPESLKIVPGEFSTRFGANHYQIEPAAQRMSLAAYKGALDNLARNAVVKSCENSPSGKARVQE
jgi:hypothetical protein